MHYHNGATRTLTSQINSGKFGAVNSNILAESSDTCICNVTSGATCLLTPYINSNGYWCCLIYNCTDTSIVANTITIRFNVLRH